VDRSTVDRAAREVFGDAPLPATQLLRQWGAAGLGLAALVGVGATLWWTLQRAQTAAPTSAMAPTTATESSPAASGPGSLPAGGTVLATGPTPAAATASATGEHANAPEADLPRLLAGARRSESAAWRDLVPLWGLPASDGLNCEGLARQQLPCWRASGGFAELRALGRPVLLQWRDARGGTVYLPLLGLGSSQAVVLLEGRAHRLPLATLAGLWRGEFTTLWRSPPGYREATADPLAAPFSSWLASRLPGDAKQPTAARVAAFQVAQGLRPDGVAGPLTLMLLNQASGVPEPRLATLP
jgi:general secretion pathway protein A